MFDVRCWKGRWTQDHCRRAIADMRCGIWDVGCGMRVGKPQGMFDVGCWISEDAPDSRALPRANGKKPRHILTSHDVQHRIHLFVSKFGPGANYNA